VKAVAVAGRMMTSPLLHGHAWHLASPTTRRSPQCTRSPAHPLPLRALASSLPLAGEKHGRIEVVADTTFVMTAPSPSQGRGERVRVRGEMSDPVYVVRGDDGRQRAFKYWQLGTKLEGGEGRAGGGAPAPQEGRTSREGGAGLTGATGGRSGQGASVAV
jgi:hypothetical protein